MINKNESFIQIGFRSQKPFSAATKTMAEKLDSIVAVDIDNGRFKYVLIRVDYEDVENKQEKNKLIVRGYAWAAFHGKHFRYAFIYWSFYLL